MSIDEYVALLREYTAERKKIEHLFDKVSSASAELSTYRNNISIDIRYRRSASSNTNAKLPDSSFWPTAAEIIDFVQKYEDLAKRVCNAYHALSLEDQAVVARPS